MSGSMKFHTYSIFLLAGLGPVCGFAQHSTGYKPANAEGCKVWQPAQRRAPDLIPQYTGGCKDGMAGGKGHLDWLNKYASMRVSQSWDGSARRLRGQRCR